jgi:hypothetical protein
MWIMGEKGRKGELAGLAAPWSNYVDWTTDKDGNVIWVTSSTEWYPKRMETGRHTTRVAGNNLGSFRGPIRNFACAAARRERSAPGRAPQSPEKGPSG